jgi:branched-chain amino acid transport system ATP-binding protein
MAMRAPAPTLAFDQAIRTAARKESVYQASGITLRFGGVTALSDVSIEVRTDELLAVIGPNGAGKTSLLNTLSGFYRPQEGKLTLMSQEVTGYAPHRLARAGIGRTFQGAHVFAGMSVVENILVARYSKMKTNIVQAFLYYPWAHREEIAHREAVEEILDFLEIEAIRHEPVGSLGYGLRKRVDLGRALAMEPKILLLDEPMAGMNVEEKEDMARFILDLRESRRLPVVLVEHDMSVVMDLAERIVVLDFGCKIAEGTPEEIQHNPEVIAAYLGGGDS